MKKFLIISAPACMLSFTGCSSTTGSSDSSSVSIGGFASERNYVANRNSGKLHSIYCDSLPYEEDRIYFSTIQEANNAGYYDNRM